MALARQVGLLLVHSIVIMVPLLLLSDREGVRWRDAHQSRQDRMVSSGRRRPTLVVTGLTA